MEMMLEVVMDMEGDKVADKVADLKILNVDENGWKMWIEMMWRFTFGDFYFLLLPFVFPAFDVLLTVGVMIEPLAVLAVRGVH